MSFTRRLVILFNEIQKNPPPLCYAEPEDSSQSMNHWIGHVDGPEGTPYAGGRFRLTIDFPSDYPFKPPSVRFITPVYHPNISATGEICLDLLHSKWSPALTIRGLLISLCSLLADPNPEHGLNKEALRLYRADVEKYNEVVKEWTKQHAQTDNH